MRVKRYIVDTLPEAVQLIRGDLGKDAVILESKEVMLGGFLGMFKKKKIEVLAAVEPDRRQETQKKKLDKSEVELVVEQILKASQKPKEAGVTETTQPIAVETQNMNKISQLKSISTSQEPVPNLFSQTYNSSKQSSSVANINQGEATDSNIKEDSIRLTEKTTEIDGATAAPSGHSMSKTEQFIIRELKHLRLEMKAMGQQQEERKTESVNISILRTHLFDQELNVEWINTLCETMQEIEEREDRILELEEIRTFAQNQFLEWLLPFSKATIEKTTQVIQLVGPTGVGKTTTIAKLAANYSMKHNKKVGFITADTYRIAAVDQLRTYANILNLPLEVVFSPIDLPRAYNELDGCDLILMDTAGRNFKSDVYVSEVNSLIANKQFSEGILVVSLTSRTRDMAIVAEKFAKYGVRKVVFTKLDEANAYGSIFNMIMQFGLQPLFVTSGQNVPDDIQQFTIESYVNLLLGDIRHE